MNKADHKKKREILRTIKRHHKNERKIAPIVSMVIEEGGIEYAREKMIEYRDKALEILKTYPESEIRSALEELVYFTTSRKM